MTLPLPIVTIRPDGKTPECIYRLDVPNYSLSHANVVGGTTCVRLERCQSFHLQYVTVSGMTGPADPDGHGIQIMNCGGVIEFPTVISDRVTEDCINIWGDDLENINRVVMIVSPNLYGRGLGSSGNGICVDGPCPPRVVVVGPRFIGNRCGFTLAAGYGHSFTGGAAYGCETDGYVENDPDYQTLPHFVPIGGLNINCPGLKKGILVPRIPIPFPGSVIVGAHAA